MAAELGFEIVASPVPNAAERAVRELGVGAASPPSEGGPGGVPAAARSPRGVHGAAAHRNALSPSAVPSQLHTTVSGLTPMAEAHARSPEPLLPSPKQLARLAPDLEP